MLEINPLNGQFKRNEDVPLDFDVLVADESSMIDVPLANSLLKKIPTAAVVIVVGDIGQLPGSKLGSPLRLLTPHRRRSEILDIFLDIILPIWQPSVDRLNPQPNAGVRDGSVYALVASDKNRFS